MHTRDLSGSDKLVLTQEAMAQMIGARRNSVSLVANTLQQANFIHYSRGHIEITNVDGLIKTAANATERSRRSTRGCCIRTSLRGGMTAFRDERGTARSVIRIAPSLRARIAQSLQPYRIITANPGLSRCFGRRRVNALFNEP